MTRFKIIKRVVELDEPCRAALGSENAGPIRGQRLLGAAPLSPPHIRLSVILFAKGCNLTNIVGDVCVHRKLQSSGRGKSAPFGFRRFL